MHECVTYCNRYLKDPPPPTASDRSARINLSVVTNVVRPFRGVLKESLTREELIEAHWVVLRDCDEVEPYMMSYRERLQALNQNKSSAWIEKMVKKKFPDYFFQWVRTYVSVFSNLYTYRSCF